MTPAEQYRYDLEATLFGQEVPRFPHYGSTPHGLTIERGSGSAFSALPDALRSRIVAADAWIAAELAEQVERTQMLAAVAKYDAAAATLKKAASAAMEQ